MKGRGLCLVILAVLVLGVQPVFAGGKQEAAGAGVTLNMWWWGEEEKPGITQWLEESIALYTRSHPSVEVNTVLQTVDTLQSAFRTAAAARDPSIGPDIQFFWPGIYLMVDVWNGALTPASDLFPKSFLDQLNVSKEVRYDGKIWAIPWYTLNWPMVYNKKMFAAAGLNPQDPPARLQQLLEACERLKSSGVTPIGVGTKDGYSFQWFLNNFGLQNFDSLGEMMALFADGDVNDARVKDVFGLLHRLYRAGYYNGNATSLSIYEGNETFKARETAMTICVFPDWIRDMGDEEVGVMYPPVYGTGRLADKSVAVTSQTLGISSWSKKQREAADFLMFFMSKERSPALYAACHAIHARKDFNAGVLETEMERTMHSWIQRFPDNGSAENFFPEKVVYEGFNPAAQLVFSDNYSPEQCMADVEKVVNEWRTLSPAEVDNYRAWSEDLR